MGNSVRCSSPSTVPFTFFQTKQRTNTMGRLQGILDLLFRRPFVFGVCKRRVEAVNDALNRCCLQTQRDDCHSHTEWQSPDRAMSTLPFESQCHETRFASQYDMKGPEELSLSCEKTAYVTCTVKLWGHLFNTLISCVFCV